MELLGAFQAHSSSLKIKSQVLEKMEPKGKNYGNCWSYEVAVNQIPASASIIPTL
jgi:hypothetical protein